MLQSVSELGAASNLHERTVYIIISLLGSVAVLSVVAVLYLSKDKKVLKDFKMNYYKSWITCFNTLITILIISVYWFVNKMYIHNMK